MAKKEKCCKYTSIGGQALIEGIMMRGPQRSAMATRLPDGTVDLEELEFHPIKEKVKFLGWPILRGVVGMVESLSHRTHVTWVLQWGHRASGATT